MKEVYAIQFIWKFKDDGTCPLSHEKAYKEFNIDTKLHYNELSNTLLVSKTTSENMIGAIVEFKEFMERHMSFIQDTMDIREATFLKIKVEGDLLSIIKNKHK